MAQDLTIKRQTNAKNAVIYFGQLREAIKALQALSEERSKFDQDFQDTDFTLDELKHVTPGMIGTAYDFVLPTFSDTYIDTANSGRNLQIINQIIA